MAAAAATLEALKARNKALKAELAKLEKLAASVDNKDSKAKVEQKLKDVDAVKAAFDHFDSDGSGFIDKAEFAALSSDLGEVLDDAELAGAIKAIDISGDGKISFNEFIRWWTSDHKSSDKSAAKIALLKTKLKAREFKSVAAPLIRQLSAVKPEDNEFVRHRIALSVGEFKDVKWGINANLSFGPIPQSVALGTPSVARVTFALAAGKSEKDLEADKKTLEALLEQSGLPFKIDVDSKQSKLHIWSGLPDDPFALAPQLGIDLQAFVKEGHVSLELPIGVADLTDGREAKLADLLALRFEAKLSFRKALVHTLANALPNAHDAAFAAFLENFNLSLNLGNMSEFLAGCVPPQGFNVNQAMVGNQIALVYLSQFAAFALQDGGKAVIKQLYDGLWEKVSGDPQVGELIALAQRSFDQPTQVYLHTGSGVIVTVDLKNAFPFSCIPRPKKAGQ
jgi:hypothetical protein